MENYLSELLRQVDNGEMTRNELSLLTGLTNSYLIALGQGNIKKVGRDKLIFIGVALDLSIPEINLLLKDFQFVDISEADTEVFLEAAKRRRVSGFQRLCRGIGFDLLLVSMERTDGPELFVSSRPSSRFKPTGAMIMENRRSNLVDPIYDRLREAFMEERKRLLTATLKEHVSHHLICERCLEEYILQCAETIRIDPEEGRLMREHIRSFLDFLRHPNLKVDLLSKCPSFEFLIKCSVQADEKDKVFFTGSGKDHKKIYGDSGLLGFATDSEKIVKHFRSEYADLKKSIIEEYSEPEDLRRHISELIGEAGIDRLLG